MWATFLRDGHEVLGGAAALPRARASDAGASCRCGGSPRTSIAGTARSRPTRSGAGSSASSRGSTAWPPGSTSWSARSRPVRATSRASSRRARPCSGVESLTVEEGLAAAAGDRSEQTVSDETLEILVDSERASFGSWYELFPRSWGGFAGVEKLLPEFAKLGFDVLYLPPVHPIGLTHRKGRNNSPTARRSDPGSPWAIGGEAGGHMALNPELGSAEDFARLTARAGELGISIALDLALNCSPDHPWLREHPDWFHRRPDGTLKYAENPPKRYQDIYNINFDTEDWRALWTALHEVVLHWVAQGVKVFRVDNPHTKPVPFWEWLIARGAGRPPRDGLPGRGVHAPGDDGAAREGRLQPVLHVLHVAQHEGELTSYMYDLTRSELPQYLRPNFFANTPDILHAYLVAGGRPAFEARLVLAATLSPSYGIYSGFERCENVPLSESSEEYLNSEKYEIKKRSLGGPLLPLIGRLNAVRRANPALQHLDNLTFLETANEHLIAYLKRTGDNAVITCVNLDPSAAHEGAVVIAPELGLPTAFDVTDLLADGVFTWRTGSNYVRLEPGLQQAHLLRVDL